MSFTITDRDLRELTICRAARVINFKRACRMRAKSPEKMSFSQLTALRTLIDDAEEDILEFRKNHLD